ncbi:FMN-dependent NADH-azoreductase [Actinomadura rubrobrunea]|uniref:FMN dependent NADH:quinone oxidoreductase n=2 Tax=Actinomadura rubrobrunea TaxID=115335 RepID=A0A9W6UXV6_9ACTN|nr:FMN-dependent NADH-azoreductase [Actinomadura rubrobrunea]
MDGDDMLSLLHIDSGAPHSDGSVSRRLTSLFAEVWRREHAAAGYRYRDLVADPVPPVGPPYVDLGRRVERRGTVPLGEVEALAANAAERRDWARTLPLIEELHAAHTVLIGAPMYNFSVPAALKAWIDRITFPGAHVDPDSGEPLLRRTRVVVVTARGGAYGPGSPRHGCDFQEPYLRAYFREHLGVPEENQWYVHAEMTLAEHLPHLARFTEMAARSLADARERIASLAARDGRPVEAPQP